MPRRTTLIAAMPDFSPRRWNLVIYRPGVTRAAFHEDDDSWLLAEGVEDELEVPSVGERLVPYLPVELRNILREDLALIRWGELEERLDCDTAEELVVVDAIPEPRVARDGGVYGVLHLFVVSPSRIRRKGAA